jgi:hypothetical protein
MRNFRLGNGSVRSGPEFDPAAFTNFIEDFWIIHEFITPGKPDKNANIEPINSTFRDECLSQHLFRNLEGAKKDRGLEKRIQYLVSPQLHWDEDTKRIFGGLAEVLSNKRVMTLP